MTYESKFGYGETVVINYDYLVSHGIEISKPKKKVIGIVTAVTFYEGGTSYDVVAQNSIRRGMSEEHLLSEGEYSGMMKFASEHI